MDPTSVLVAAIGAMASVAAAIVTARTTARNARSGQAVALRQIEADAYARARASYEAAMATDKASYEAAIGRLRARVAELERQVSRWSRQMRAAGLVPVSVDEEEGVV